MSAPESDALLIAGKAYHSRLLVGTGKYKDHDETRRAIVASGAQIVTVAVRRVNIGQNAGEPNLLEVLPQAKFRTCRILEAVIQPSNRYIPSRQPVNGFKVNDPPKIR